MGVSYRRAKRLWKRYLLFHHLTSYHSVMIRSAHSTSETKIAGLPNFAPHSFKSVSVTPRARERGFQEKTGICFAMVFLGGFAQQRPARRNDGVCGCFPHEVVSLYRRVRGHAGTQMTLCSGRPNPSSLHHLLRRCGVRISRTPGEVMITRRIVRSSRESSSKQLTPPSYVLRYTAATACHLNGRQVGIEFSADPLLLDFAHVPFYSRISLLVHRVRTSKIPL